MGPLSAIRAVFSLDTLDTRLTADARSSSPPKDPTAPSIQGPQIGESSRGRYPKEETRYSLWRTPEFFAYYLVFIIVIPMMFKAASDLSQESHPNYKIYQHLLQEGWIAGRKVDNSDQQYASFRNNIPTLAGVMSLQFVLRRGYEFIFTKIFPTPPPNSSYRPGHRLNKRKIFDILFACIFLFALHSLSLIKILFICFINFLISYFHPSSIWVPILTWIFNMGILFANERYRGYQFRELLPWLIAGEGSGVGYAMDKFMNGGLLNRWEISFNITVMRLISYNLDHYWAAVQLESGVESEEGTVIEVGGLAPNDAGAAADEELGRVGGSVMEPEEEERLMMNRDDKKKQADPANLSERDRVSNPARIEDYGLLNYLAYALYTPLYLAGPIITFNDFVHQQKYSSPSLKVRRIALYAIRLVFSILVMEFILHFMYVVAISKTGSRGSWAGATPFQLAMLGYFNLHIIWLKLMIPWRFFRLWALVDGVDPVENMLRCMSNNYSALLFWRSWHRSFNRWTVRYIYIPIGGARRPLINMLAVFTFVALWHDISMKLLVWGWLIVLFIAPEVFAKRLCKRERFGDHATLYRMVCAIGSVGNVLMMMVANLIGFAIGLDGMKDMIHGIGGSFNGMAFVVIACCTLFVAIQVMYELREHERRHGIDLRC